MCSSDLDFSEYETAIEFWKDYGGGYMERDMDEGEALEALRDETCLIEFDGGIIVQAF